MTAAKKAAKKSKALAKPIDKAKKPLTKQERIFVKAYLKHKKPYDAAIEAGYSETIATSKAYSWVSNGKLKPNVYNSIQAGLKKLEEKLELSAENVLKRYVEIANTDRNELVEMRMVPCHYCYGKDHKYQYTPSERDKAMEQHVRRLTNLKLVNEDGMPNLEKYPFDEKGGLGYTIHKEPHPECPECHGIGIEKVIYKNTNTPAAAAIYSGVKETRHGKEIQLLSQKDALDAIARHLGLFNDKLKLQGDENNPLTLLIGQLQQATLRPVTEDKPDDKSGKE